jgi:hypothetical protein
MPSHESALVARLAQRHAGVLSVLLDVVGVAGAGRIADTARQLFDAPDVQALFGGQLVVHK